MNGKNPQAEMSRPQQVICRSCGAEYPSELPACPYCGTMNLPAAEKEYMNKLEDVRSDLEELSGLAGREAGRGTKALLKKLMIAVAAAVLVLLAVLGYNSYRARAEAEKEKAEYLWQREAFAEMDRLYSAGDYDALLELYLDAGGEGHHVWDYAHRDFCEYMLELNNAQYLLAQVEKGVDDRVMLFQSELLLYRLERLTSLTAEERQMLEEMRAPLLEDLQSRFQLSEEELSTFRKTLDREGYLSYNDCEAFLKDRGMDT